MAVALFSSPPTPTLPPSSSSSNPSIPHLNKPFLPLFSRPKKTLFLSHSISDNGAGIATSPPPPPPPPLPTEDAQETSPPAEELGSSVKKFDDPRWVNGTWDLKQFFKNGSTDWDAVIDAEARRRKFLENTPEPSDNADPVVFDTSIIPWWAWIKKYHLPEAELLNGRAAMVGFFMAYFVDSLTGVGLVDQMGNFFCKTLLLVAVSGVLLIRKNEDIETLKKLIDESTFYDKQWQATWKEDSNSGSKKD